MYRFSLLLLAGVAASSPLPGRQGPGGPPDHVLGIYVLTTYEHENNSPLPSNPYTWEVFVEADLISGTVTPPGGTPIPLVEDSPGEWELAVEVTTAVPLSGAIALSFVTPSGTDSATVIHAPPADPGLAHVVWPKENDGYYPLDPGVEWLPIAPQGSQVWVDFLDSSDTTLDDGVLSPDATSWIPQASLAPGQAHAVYVDVEDSLPGSGATASGDTFFFASAISISNHILLSTCASVTSLSTAIDAEVQQPGGVAAVVPIGMLDAWITGSATVEAKFSFDAAHAALDNCYDFRWVNVLEDVLVSDLPIPAVPVLGALPVVEPVQGQTSAKYGTADDVPFFNNDLFWESAHQEGIASHYKDTPKQPSDWTLRFRTYLVAQDHTAGDFGSTEFRVLGGFTWVFNGGTRGESLLCGLVPAASAEIALIEQALANAAALPSFLGWGVAPAGALNSCPKLVGLPSSISVSAGGAQSFSLNMGPPFGGSGYWILASQSGTSPGTTLASTLLPLNFDALTNFSIVKANQAPFVNTAGVLNSLGGQTAGLAIPVGSSPTLAGVHVDFAYVVFDALSGTVLGASNATGLDFVP